MPGGFPTLIELCNPVQNGIDTTNTRGTQVTTGAANTKGSFAQLVLSTPSDCSFIEIVIELGSFSTGPVVAVDIAFGASKVVVFPNLTACANNRAQAKYFFPCSIPAGTNIWARAQSIASADVVSVMVNTYDTGFLQMDGYAGIDAIGFNSGTTLGTAIAPSATANTKGSFAQLTASTANSYCGFFLAIDYTTVGGVKQEWMIDIAFGAGNTVVFPNYLCGEMVGQVAPTPPSAFYPMQIPAGTLISARSQCSIGSGATPNLVFYGVF